MKKKGLILGLLMTGSLVLSSCVKANITTNNTGMVPPDFPGNGDNPFVVSDGTITPVDSSAAEAKDPEESKVVITDEFVITNIATNVNIVPVDGVYTITDAGDYLVKGKLENGMIYVDSPDSEIILNLSGVSMTSNVNSCIYVNQASKVEISANKDTYNEIIDNRELKTTLDDAEEELGSAAIYSLSDLKIKGKGSLVVKSSYNNGIHTKDDLDIKNVNLKVSAVNNCLKGNDSVNIESGELILVSSAGDGIKTTSTDISSKGNQRGTVTITGGIIDIYSACDGIDAAYDINISETEETVPSVNIYTSNYSSYTEDVVEKSTTKMYLKLSQAYTAYRYAFYFYNDEGVGEFYNLNYEGETQGRTKYYYYSANIPTNYNNVKLYAFNQTDENSLDNYVGVSAEGTINNMYDTCQVTSLSNGMIKYTWTMNTLNMSQGGMSGNSNSLDYSAKGLKSDNNISISGGQIKIKSTDDSIHANRGTTLENGSTGIGNVNISGGTLELVTKDDAIHADYVLTFDGSNTTITEAYEGLEANQIYINSGNIKLSASDDGVNASGSALSVLVKVTGGFLDVSVSSGDTDGIDSNGSYVQTGGFVIAKTLATGGGCGAVDVDGTITVSGGTIIAAGPMEKLPSTSSINYVKFGSTTQMGGGMFGPGQSTTTGSVSFTSGSYTVYDSSNNSLFSFELNSNYSSMWMASDSFIQNATYTLKNSSTTYSWTQSTQAATGN
ncbi:MAG: carbohydrate-binding domain-containing protein [Acholeplasmatales bacterium]|nr:carbohydrate-binding domain-containing protein [Acholeplasmatales bacterium]